MKIHLRSGFLIETNMKHGDFVDIMNSSSNHSFIIVPDINNQLKLYNIRKEAIDMIVVE